RLLRGEARRRRVGGVGVERVEVDVERQEARAEVDVGRAREAGDGVAGDIRRPAAVGAVVADHAELRDRPRAVPVEICRGEEGRAGGVVDVELDDARYASAELVQ